MKSLSSDTSEDKAVQDQENLPLNDDYKDEELVYEDDDEEVEEQKPESTETTFLDLGEIQPTSDSSIQVLSCEEECETLGAACQLSKFST